MWLRATTDLEVALSNAMCIVGAALRGVPPACATHRPQCAQVAVVVGVLDLRAHVLLGVAASAPRSRAIANTCKN